MVTKSYIIHWYHSVLLQMSRRVLCTKQESWATVLVCRKNLLTRFRIVFCFIRVVLHLVSCRYFSHAEVLVTTSSRTVSRLLKILVRFLLNRSTLGKKNRFWLACVAGACKQWAQEKTGCVSLARTRSLFRPLLPSACYAGQVLAKSPVRPSTPSCQRI